MIFGTVTFGTVVGMRKQWQNNDSNAKFIRISFFNGGVLLFCCGFTVRDGQQCSAPAYYSNLAELPPQQIQKAN